jgi:hypothetical protein
LILKEKNIDIKMNKIYKNIVWFFWIFGLIPIYFYFKNLLLFSQNIPHWDDYALIAFVNKYNLSSGFFEKVQLIFAQHNEHRIAFTRIVSLFIYKINGSLNFQWMIFVGNFALFGILYLFYSFLKNNRISINYLVPICFFLFQLSHFENSYWGMASVQNFWVVLFVLLSLWAFSENKIPYFWAFMAAFTSANGVLFVPILGCMVLIFNKNYVGLIRFSIFSALLLFLYFVTYSQPAISQAIKIDFFENIKATSLTFGSVFDVNWHSLIEDRIDHISFLGFAFAILFTLVLLFKYLKNRKLNNIQANNFVILTVVFLFVLGTCLLTSLSRLQYGSNVFLTSKYKIYSIIGLCSFYLLIIVNFKYFGKTIFLLLFGLFSVYLFVISYFYSIQNIKNYTNAENATIYNGWHNGKKDVSIDLKSAFQYKNNFLDTTFINDTTKTEFELGKVEIKDSMLFITNKLFEISSLAPNVGAYLEFVSDSNKYIFATKQVTLNNKKGYFFKNNSFYGKGFTAEIPLTEIKTGDYFINILCKTDTSFVKINTNYYAEIEGIKPKSITQNW